MPAHLEPAGGLERDGEAASGLLGHALVRVEAEATRLLGGAGRETPGYAAELALALEGAEGAGGIGVDVEAGVGQEAL